MKVANILCRWLGRLYKFSKTWGVEKQLKVYEIAEEETGGVKERVDRKSAQEKGSSCSKAKGSTRRSLVLMFYVHSLYFECEISLFL